MKYGIKISKLKKIKTTQISKQKKTNTMTKSLNRSWNKPRSRLSSSSVPSLAAERPFQKRIAFRHTFIFIMEHSPSSVPFLAATRPLVRSKTWKFIWESTKTSDLISVRRVAGRALEQRAIWETMSVATLEKSKCNLSQYFIWLSGKFKCWWKKYTGWWMISYQKS